MGIDGAALYSLALIFGGEFARVLSRMSPSRGGFGRYFVLALLTVAGRRTEGQK
jgi:hypothetical protein